MDELDLDSFIANMEQTAPDEPVQGKLTCNECGSKLEEEEDGNLACPVCCVQATNVMQFDETELHHDESGRPVYGQRVKLVDHKTKHQIDYGWAWSTDEAIAHILSLQLDALEEAKLVPDLFRAAITNMWLKYWLETVAPYIKDEYSEGEMLQISSDNALKLRDVEVLFKLRDKIMVPLRCIRGTQDIKRIYHMLGVDFTKTSPDNIESDDDNDDADDGCYDGMGCDEVDNDDRSSNSTVSSDGGRGERVPEQLIHEFDRLMSNEPTQRNRAEQQSDEETEPAEGEKENDIDTLPADDMENLVRFYTGRTRNLSSKCIKILTPNRTLAFIEATARCLPDDDPLFAADIIRACDHHLIPFYAASKCLPETMKLNSRDKLMFQETTPPNPIQLTRAASLLINNIYKDQLPKTLPVPDLNTILKRFIKDMNLPEQLMGIIRNKVSFLHFESTRPKTFVSSVNRRLPQYDRWAFAVLVHHLKILFNLGDEYLKIQKQSALEATQASSSGERYFIMSDWILQISSRLGLILRHDPYALHHPSTQLDKLEISSQLAKYIELQIESAPTAEIRVKPGETFYDANFRSELADVLRREIRPPKDVKHAIPKGEKLEAPRNIRYPITDAFERTRILWSSKLDPNLSDIIYEDFSKHHMLSLTNLPRWSVCDKQVSSNATNLQVSPTWPQAFKVLLDVGAFLCFCKPAHLVNEVILVEKALKPVTRETVRKVRLSQRIAPIQSYNKSS